MFLESVPNAEPHLQIPMYLVPILPNADRREAEPKGAQLDMRGVLTIFRNKAFIAFVMPSLGLTSK